MSLSVVELFFWAGRQSNTHRKFSLMCTVTFSRKHSITLHTRVSIENSDTSSLDVRRCILLHFTFCCSLKNRLHPHAEGRGTRGKSLVSLNRYYRRYALLTCEFPLNSVD